MAAIISARCCLPTRLPASRRRWRADECRAGSQRTHWENAAARHLRSVAANTSPRLRLEGLAARNQAHANHAAPRISARWSLPRAKPFPCFAPNTPCVATKHKSMRHAANQRSIEQAFIIKATVSRRITCVERYQKESDERSHLSSSRL